METCFKAERTTDLLFISDILTHPQIYPHITDDGELNLTDDVVSDNLFWIRIKDKDEDLGLFLAHAHNYITFEMHTCLLPCSYGLRAKKASYYFGKWMFENTNCQKIITQIPEYNKLAVRFAKQGGLIQEGVNRKSFMKNGILMDQYIFGITKEEFLCQQPQ